MAKGGVLLIGSIAAAAVGGGIAYAASRRKEEVPPTTEDILCQSQYCASSGGDNQPVSGIQVNAVVVSTGEPYFAGETDSKGELIIPLTVGEQYDFTAVYKESVYVQRMTYKGNQFLLVCVNLAKEKIDSMGFFTIAPVPPVNGKAKLEIVKVGYGSPDDFSQGSSHEANITIKNTGGGIAVLGKGEMGWNKESFPYDRDIGPVFISGEGLKLAAGSSMTLKARFTIPDDCPTGDKKHMGFIPYDDKTLDIPEAHAFTVVKAGLRKATVELALDPILVGVGDRVTVACNVRAVDTQEPVGGVTVVFRDWTDDREVFRQKTNDDGYMGKYWYPNEDYIGGHQYYAYTVATDKFDTAVSDKKYVTVTSGSALELVGVKYK